MLNIGCGRIKFEGWINVDMSDEWGKEIVDAVWDATKPFPLPDSSCQFIYNEHFIEHLTVEQGFSFIRECKRLLKPGGILRIATPSLEYIVDKYQNDWKNQEWLTKPGAEFIKTRAEMINISFREWGHKWIYDNEELIRRITEAGFTVIVNVDWGKSDYAELCNRETRQESMLIIEALKS